jgi:hypothetical protein
VRVAAQADKRFKRLVKDLEEQFEFIKSHYQTIE